MSLVTYHRTDHSMYDIFAPLLENEGSGVPLRYTATYDQIKEARREDDHGLSRGIWKTEYKRADWVEVESLCTVALATQSKDLQVFGYLMESWLVMEGLKGGIKGFQTLIVFCEAFWPILYPQLNEDDDARLFVFDWIDKTLQDRLLYVEITPALDNINLRSLTLADWIEAVNFEKIIKRAGESKNFIADAEAKGKITLNRFRRGLAVAPKQELQLLYADATTLLTVIHAFCQAIELYAGQQTPAFMAVHEHITTLSRIVQTTLEQRKSDIIIENKSVENSEQVENMLITGEGEATENTENSIVPAQESEGEIIAQRADAYRAIHELGKFLMEIDPHSPAPYLLELIVSWENKKLLQIVTDINEGKSEAHNLLKLLAGATSSR
ncbi:MAG: type VI secretion system protein TssA [Pseudomonadota bacterium]